MLAAAVAAALTVGLVTGFSLAGRESTASRTAQGSEALYAEVQDLSFSLADANATAATALLIGPETPSQFSSRYNSDIAEAEDLLAAASQRVTGDAYASGQLRSVAEHIPEYTGLIGQALADNRLGYPVAGAYLRQASLLLTGSMLVETGNVVAEQQSSTNGGIGAASEFPWWVLALGVLAAFVLWWVSGYLAELSHRRINLGLLGAAVVVIGLLGWSLYAFGGAGIASSNARNDFGWVSLTQDETSQLALAETYVALQQIDRGEDQGADAKAAAKALGAAEPVDGGTSSAEAAEKAYSALQSCANKAIDLAADGNYQQAITATVGNGAKVGEGGCEPDANTLHEDLLKVFDESQANFDADMTSLASQYAGSGALPLGLAFGIAGAAAAAYGVNRRLAEFR